MNNTSDSATYLLSAMMSYVACVRMSVMFI